MKVEKNQKLNIFELLKIEDLDASFVKIEILDYDASNDSVNFDLDAFPSGVNGLIKILSKPNSAYVRTISFGYFNEYLVVV